MGNTSTSLGGKDSTSATRQPRGGRVGEAGGLYDRALLRIRFEQLAKPLPSTATVVASGEQSGDPSVTAVGTTIGSASAQKFVLFEDCSKLEGARGVEVAARLYRVLDAGGDGRLDFQEFSSGACLLKGSPEEDKLQLLFKMYSDTGKAGVVGRDGLRAFILDMIAASPPPIAPPGCKSHRGVSLNGRKISPPIAGIEGGSLASNGDMEGVHSGVMLEGARWGGVEDQGVTDFELELKDVLDRMTGVVLAEHDSDGDGMLSEKEWKAYLQREEDGVGAFLETLSDSVGQLLLLQ